MSREQRKPGQWQRPLFGIPVGVERVLFHAAMDEAFYRALLEDREGALSGSGHELRPSELAMLRGIPEPQLRAAIAGIDTSQHNLQRRTFLKAVAAAAAGAAVVEGASACTGTRPDEPDSEPPKPDGGTGDDAEAVHDGPPAATGIRPG